MENEQADTNGVIVKIMGYDVILSEIDVEKVLEKKWSKKEGRKDRVYFLCKTPERRSLYLHRFIMECPANMQVDHINMNTLDNRRENLRICTSAENSRNKGKCKRNKSGFKGVDWQKQLKKWRAQIQYNYKTIHLGLFSSPELAHKAYCEAAVKYYGEFARFE